LVAIGQELPEIYGPFELLLAAASVTINTDGCKTFYVLIVVTLFMF